jgi:heme ABC exporter ATP-binding subunit CcmA
MIVARRLAKRYGSHTVLRAVDLEIGRGEALLVTGPNGSGKTTLLRIVAGLAAPTSGTIEVDLDRRDLGFVGHEPLVYRDLTATENLSLYARLYRVPDPRARVVALLERFGLRDAADTRVAAFSRGMTQRLALARGLLHQPALLVLDEPHTALDAAGAALLDEELALLSGKTTMVISTHGPERVAPLATATLALGER